MPLIIICGKPSVGKSFRTQQLCEYLKENHPNSKIFVAADDEDLERNSIYADSKKELSVRGSLKSRIERELSKETIVIADSLNYIKGYRYELHCLAKYVRTTYCVIHVDGSEEEILNCNQKKVEEERYSETIIKELIMRFEEPNAMMRWDKPFFFVHGPSEDPLPCEKICEAIFDKNIQKPNLSTQNPPMQSPDFVFQADKLLQSIAGAILAGQRTEGIGATLSLPGTQETYKIKQKISVGEMRRQRKQFLTFLRANPVSDVSLIPNNFIHFLTNATI